MFPDRTTIFLITSLCFIFISCQPESTASTKSSGTDDVITATVQLVEQVTAEVEYPFSIVEKDDWGTNISEKTLQPQLKVISSLAEIQTVTDSISPEAAAKLEIIDYNSQMVLIIWQGQKPTSQYGVYVRSIKLVDNELKIVTEFKEPQIGTEISDIVTYPYQAIEISKSNKIKKYLVIVNEKIILTHP